MADLTETQVLQEHLNMGMIQEHREGTQTVRYRTVDELEKAYRLKKKIEADQARSANGGILVDLV